MYNNYVYIFVHVRVCVCVYVCARVHVIVSAKATGRAYVRLCVCTCECIYRHLCLHIPHLTQIYLITPYARKCIHIYKRTHTHCQTYSHDCAYILFMHAHRYTCMYTTLTCTLIYTYTHLLAVVH